MIDIETLIFIHILTNFFFSLVALFAFRQTQRVGARYWGFALAAQAAGWLIFVFRTILPVSFCILHCCCISWQLSAILAENCGFGLI